MKELTSKKDVVRVLIKENLTVSDFNKLVSMLDKEPSDHNTQIKNNRKVR